MELREIHIAILQLIHDSSNHCIKKSDLVKHQTEFPNFTLRLEELLNGDFIEFELHENTYYLAYEGFEVIEKLKEEKTSNMDVQKSALDEYQAILNTFGGVKRFQRLTILAIVVFGLFGTLLLYMDSNLVESKKQIPQESINKEALSKLGVQLEGLIDSIKNSKNRVLRPTFQSIIDSANIKGAILIYNLQEDLYFSNDFKWSESGKLPASTFKIVNSIIALETGVVESERKVFKWDGEKRALKNWEQDLMLRDAFHFSCVPCYQEIAREIGANQMLKYLDVLNYGEMKVDSNNIDIFWLEGDSRISQFQQIDFLKRFYQSELPISERTEKIMKNLMVVEENDDFRLLGKTGWSIRNGNNNGWFVGYIESNNNAYFFATNIVPTKGFNMKLFPMIRKAITYKAFQQMKIIQEGRSK